MQKLIENKRYDKALSYSLHSYISSWLKYCDCKSYTLNDDECATINSYIKKIKKEECDLSLHKVLYHLKFYALEKGIKNKLINVTNEFWKNPVQVDDIESIVESDWIF